MGAARIFLQEGTSLLKEGVSFPRGEAILPKKTDSLPRRTASFTDNLLLIMSRDSSVGIATGYGLDDQGVGFRFPVGSRIFSPPRRSDWLWGPPNLTNGYRGLFRRE
jgi:hypothetical protein